jgi:tetratricopeptide (TPR) repeat protein
MIQDLLWHTYTQLGCQAYFSGDLALSETLFVAALEEAQRDKRNQTRLATSMSNLALVYSKQNHTQAACRLFKKAMVLYETLYGKANFSVVKCLDNIAALHFAQGEYIVARRMYKKTIATIEQLLGADHPFLADRLLRLAMIHSNLGQCDQALAYYARMRAIAHKNANAPQAGATGALRELI